MDSVHERSTELAQYHARDHQSLAKSLMEQLMKHTAIAFIGIAAAIASCCPAHADQLTLPEEIGRIEAPRDMNIFQLEPTVINERYYTSGRAERHQYVGNVLPAGAEIPDCDAPAPVVKHKPGSLPTTRPAAATSPARPATTAPATTPK